MSAQPAELPRKAPIYLYAIVPARQGIDEAIGVDSVPDRLWTIAPGPFAAVVGDGPNVEGRSREELMLRLLSHQKTIERIMQAAPLLPVKFGTFAPDEACVRAMLACGGPAFKAAFDRLAGCVQVEIFVKWDVETVFAEIAKEEAITGLKKKWELHVGPSDEALRVVLGGLVKQSLERRRAALAASLFGTLRTVAADAIACPVAADQVALHAVLLMKTGETAALDGCLEDLDATYGGRLAFRCVGPLAPYSFATVEIEIVEAAALDQAMRLLGVGPAADAAEVRAAYRRAVKSVHPDATGESAGGSASMAALGEAHRILSLHAEAGGDPHPSDRSVFVSVRRQEIAFDAAA